MRAFLTETQPVTKTAAAKNEVRSDARNFKPGTFQDIPTEDASDDVSDDDRLSVPLSVLVVVPSMTVVVVVTND